MPRAEGWYSYNVLCLCITNSIPSWNTQSHRKRDEVERASTPPMRYCQVCEKQCRDENGFKCHAASESHLRQMLVVGENAGRHISDFSSQFQSEFVALLSRRFVVILLFAASIIFQETTYTHNTGLGTKLVMASIQSIKYYPGQAPSTHELNTLGHSDRIYQASWSDRCRQSRRNRERVVHCMDR